MLFSALAHVLDQGRVQLGQLQGPDYGFGTPCPCWPHSYPTWSARLLLVLPCTYLPAAEQLCCLCCANSSRRYKKYRGIQGTLMTQFLPMTCEGKDSGLDVLVAVITLYCVLRRDNLDISRNNYNLTTRFLSGDVI